MDAASSDEPILWAGLAGFTSAERARIAQLMQAREGPRWRLAAFADADAWIVNGGRVRPIGEDAIDRVLDYDFIRDAVVALAGMRRFALQETVCEAIAAICFEDARVRRVRVRTNKPDIYPDAQIGCEIVRTR